MRYWVIRYEVIGTQVKGDSCLSVLKFHVLIVRLCYNQIKQGKREIII